jgi:hypothetical protein
MYITLSRGDRGGEPEYIGSCNASPQLISICTVSPGFAAGPAKVPLPVTNPFVLPFLF